MNRGSSEKSETSADEYLIQIFQVRFCFGIILKVILKKEVKMDHTKMDSADLSFPCQELSNGGLGIVAALLVHLQLIFFACVHWGPIQM